MKKGRFHRFYVLCRILISTIGLFRDNGVCIFGAVTPVAALFILEEKMEMKKTCFAILIVLILATVLLMCVLNYTGKDENDEHDVVLVLLSEGKEIERKCLTRCSEGAAIYNPSDYKIYPSIIDGYVIENDRWCNNASMYSTAFFPMTMPDENLYLYASVRPLTNISNIQFISAESAFSYFSSQSELLDSYDVANIDSETSYYEISEYSVAGIKNILRYYPAKQTIYLIRGYSVSNQITSNVIIQDSYNIGFSINLQNHTIQCKGIYSRVGVSSYSASTGTVEITYDIQEIAVDNNGSPIVPNFATINYTYLVTDASNPSKMNELWNADGYEYSKKCYSQINTLLSSLHERIDVFE